MQLLGKRIIFRASEEKQEDKNKIVLLPHQEEIQHFLTGEVVEIGSEVTIEPSHVFVNKHQADRIDWNGEKNLYVILEESVIAYDRREQRQQTKKIQTGEVETIYRHEPGA